MPYFVLWIAVLGVEQRVKMISEKVEKFYLMIRHINNAVIENKAAGCE